MAIVFDHNHAFNQSPYLPELSPALNSPPPYSNYQDHHHAAGRLLFSDHQPLQFPSQFPYGQTGGAAQLAVEDVGSGPRIPGCHVGELEKLVYSNTASFEDGMQFLFEEDGSSKNGNSGLISDLDWGEMSSLISAPLLYPSSVANDLMIGSSYNLEQQKL